MGKYTGLPFYITMHRKKNDHSPSEKCEIAVSEDKIDDIVYGL
jgi:hypothetical protein